MHRAPRTRFDVDRGHLVRRTFFSPIFSHFTVFKERCQTLHLWLLCCSCPFSFLTLTVLSVVRFLANASFLVSGVSFHPFGAPNVAREKKKSEGKKGGEEKGRRGTNGDPILEHSPVKFRPFVSSPPRVNLSACPLRTAFAWVLPLHILISTVRLPVSPSRCRRCT